MKRDGFYVVTNMTYDVALYSSWSKCTCNHKTDIMRIGGP